MSTPAKRENPALKREGILTPKNVLTEERNVVSYLSFEGLESIFAGIVKDVKLKDPFFQSEILIYLEPTPEELQKSGELLVTKVKHTVAVATDKDDQTTDQPIMRDFDFETAVVSTEGPARSSDRLNDLANHPDTAVVMGVPHNKPVNLLLYCYLVSLYKKRLISEDDNNEFKHYLKFFRFEYSNPYSAQSYIKVMKSYVFIYMILMTRGFLPSPSLDNQTNKLPKILIENMGYPANSIEQLFANDISSVDTRKINWAGFLRMNHANLPDEIRNRVKKGFAGSRILKLFRMSEAYLDPRPSNTENPIAPLYQFMLDTSKNSFCYINLHPLLQKVQSKFDRFYLSMIVTIARKLGEAMWDMFKQDCMQIPSFQKDRQLKALRWENNHILIEGSPDYTDPATINIEVLRKAIGNPVVFEESE